MLAKLRIGWHLCPESRWLIPNCASIIFFHFLSTRGYICEKILLFEYMFSHWLLRKVLVQIKSWLDCATLLCGVQRGFPFVAPLWGNLIGFYLLETVDELLHAWKKHFDSIQYFCSRWSEFVGACSLRLCQKQKAVLYFLYWPFIVGLHHKPKQFSINFRICNWNVVLLSVLAHFEDVWWLVCEIILLFEFV